MCFYSTLSICPTISFMHCVHKSVLYVCISIAALQVGSSVASFWIPYIWINIQYLSFSFWLTSICTISSRSSTLLQLTQMCSFYSWVIFHYIYVPCIGEDPLENKMATHSSILAWRIPWREEPLGLHSIGSQNVGHDWAANTFTIISVSIHLSMDIRLLPWTRYYKRAAVNIVSFSIMVFSGCMPSSGTVGSYGRSIISF